ncbi:MAG: type IV pilus assembly protein PilM [Planctomycetota bacterium]|nr:type IV pilus assembly protein PilM [Planctomycetota bacterium]
MAENRAVWGIDIGQAGLKAVRLKYAAQAEQVLAVAYDYIPHPKILSQPDAIPRELIKQALETFLSRNDVTGDLVAISLPGHSALARFIQLPPVESSKVADVVKYEARQQIPFALEDVIWDFQTLGGGIEESGFMLGAEVGLFAMKTEQVYEALRPFTEAKVEVEVVQIAPLALYNFYCYDTLGIRPTTEDEFVAPEEHTIMLDMGTDNTTLVVSNGEKIWIRNVPVGGNHFTRALTKEMKLTFAKAEHLKCNATKSPDPRAVFQALRPVFNDYVSEIQRSIGYFSSVNRDAKISKIIGVGNGFKLAGLQKFLQQNLQYDVERVETFDAVVGDTVLNAPVFQENIMTFAVPYGLALQALKLTKLRTTLLPKEIAVARKIRRKKPWAVATAATVLCGLATSVAGYANAAAKVNKERFGEVESAADSFKSALGSGQSAYESARGTHDGLVEKGTHLVSYLDKRELWAELYRGLNEALPRPVGLQLDEKDLTKMPRINIRSITAKRYADLKTWFDGLREQDKTFLTEAEKAAGPQGEGYVITLMGEHYYAPPNDRDRGIIFVRDTLVENLRKPFIKQGDNFVGPVPVAVLGISHPVITDNPPPVKVELYENGVPRTGDGPPGGFRPGLPRPSLPQPGTGPAQPGTGSNLLEPEFTLIERTTFTLQFAWKPTQEKDRVIPDAPAPATEGISPGIQPASAGNPGGVPTGVVPGNVAPGAVAPEAAPAESVPALGQ